MSKKRSNIIWSNENLYIKDYEDYFKEEYPNKKLSDSEKYDIIYDLNNSYIDDERSNLDIKTEGEIIAIGDIGTWRGRVRGYQRFGKNIKNILSTGSDYVSWYAEKGNIKATMHHHDGTNYLEYREVREGRDIEPFLKKLYNQEPITRQQINYYTKSIYHYVAKVYGW